MKNSYHWQTFLYRRLGKAYEASKRIHKIKKDYFLYKDTLPFQKCSWRSIIFYTNTELNNSIFSVYLSLLGYRIGLYLIKLFNLIRYMIPNRGHKKIISGCYGNLPRNALVLKYARELSDKFNRRLAWIEATLNDLYTWKRYYSFPSSLSIDRRGGIEYPSLGGSRLAAIAYESIGLLPRSITRTSSRFKAELMNRSGSLVLWEFRLAKYQALASLQYIGCLILIPLAISIFSKKCLSEPWISYCWNSNQSQIFITSFQEKKALEQLQEIEELLWLERIMTNASFATQLQDSNGEIHQRTIELVDNFNNDSIEIISHLLTDVIYSIAPSGLFVLGRERLVILNYWAQELFYSLSDTTKAFSILLLTDPCIGFHSPHGWEIVISSCLEHFGFVRNRNVISCFVSTFPVILDTVFKYLIFRHLNRISPSIVATYHTMNE